MALRFFQARPAQASAELKGKARRIITTTSLMERVVVIIQPLPYKQAFTEQAHAHNSHRGIEPKGKLGYFFIFDLLPTGQR